MKEKIKVKEIIDNFRNIHAELNFYESSLTSMEKGLTEKRSEKIKELGDNIKKCIERLYKEREKERKLLGEMEIKYGPGEIDLNTFEYKPKS